MYTKQLSIKEEFEFYYLIELTKQKIKPLSRWEKPSDSDFQNYIRKHGLFVEVVPRKTFLRNTVYETVFSTSNRHMEFYKKKFQNTFLKRDESSQKYEGYLFGYPSCCIEAFVKKPYSKNAISKEDQSLLFHWACDNCRVTPELIPYYKAVHDEVKHRHQNEIAAQSPKTYYPYRKQLRAAFGTLLLSAGMIMGQSSDTTHYIPLLVDSNNNGLSYEEEIYLGSFNETSQPHACCSYANYYAIIINSLPDSIHTDQPYRIPHMMRGIVQCSKCGEYINMGYVAIYNPLRNLTLEIPYIGLHYMEKGYFSYESTNNSGRVDISTLKKILFPYDQAHMLSVEGDTDGDGLTDTEENSLWLNPMINDADNNGIPDGAQIAEELVRLFPKLKDKPDNLHSSVKLQLTWGMENCQVCGSVHNMGYVEITNPENKNKIEVPLVALHALAHGSFAHNGTVHKNERLAAVDLIRALKTHIPFIYNDTDNDGLSDKEEEYFNLDLNKTDTDNNDIPDTKELALKFVNDINSLPTEPKTDEPYIEYLGMDGIHLCSVCGKEVVMGIMKIHNPLINTIEPLEISNYAFHFLENGSFEHEGLPDWLKENNRIDPIKLSNYLYGSVTGIEQEVITIIPKRFALQQNYPNPFNPTTKIQFSIPEAAHVTLRVYNPNGQEIKMLVNEERAPGTYEIPFNGNGLSNGIYFYRIKAGKYSETKKMILLK